MKNIKYHLYSIIFLITLLVSIGVSYGTILTKLNHIEKTSNKALSISSENNDRIIRIETTLIHIKNNRR